MKKLLSIILCMIIALSVMPAFSAFAEPVSEVMQVVNCSEWVSLRAFADTSSSRVEKVHLGEYVTNCTPAENGFVQCRFDGKSGFVLAKYLKTTTLTVWDELLKNQQVVNCEEWVSLRETTSTSAARLAKVPLGAVVTGCVLDGGWIRCTYNGKTGYILNNYLNNATYSGTVVPKPASKSAIMYVTNCNSFVSLRQSASTSASRIAKVHKGELVKVTGETANGFTKCTYNGKTGYILSGYLAKTSFSTSDKILPNQKVTNLTSWVALRQAPSTSSARLDKVYLDEIVTKCVKVGNYVYCEYNGKTGYIYATYLKNAY